MAAMNHVTSVQDQIQTNAPHVRLTITNSSIVVNQALASQTVQTTILIIYLKMVDVYYDNKA